jgi:O-antigen/teichoic acid export membrane protein
MVWRRLISHLPLNILQALAGFGAVAAFTRLLDPADYGRYALALSAMMLAHTLAFSWVEAAAFRFLPAARAQGREKDHFASLLALAGIAATLAGLIAGLALWLSGLPEAIAAAAWFAAGAVFLRFLTKIARETDRADHAVARYSICEGVYVAAGFGLGVGAITAFDLGPAGPFLGLLAAGAIVAAADLPRLLAGAKGGRADPALMGSYAAYGAALGLALALDLVVQTAARFILALTHGANAVGALAAAQGLAGRTLDLVFIWAGIASAPLVLSAFERGGAVAASPVARRMAGVLLALAAPAAVGLWLVAAPLSAVMVGEGLRAETASLLPWLAAAGLCQGLGLYYFSEAFQLTRKTAERAVLMLIPAAVTICATALLAPSFGAAGAAQAALLGAATTLITLAAFGRRHLELPWPWKDFVKITLCCVAMALIVNALPHTGSYGELFVKAILGGFVYVSSALLLDICGARAALSAVLKSVSGKVLEPSEKPAG